MILWGNFRIVNHFLPNFWRFWCKFIDFFETFSVIFEAFWADFTISQSIFMWFSRIFNKYSTFFMIFRKILDFSPDFWGLWWKFVEFFEHFQNIFNDFHFCVISENSRCKFINFSYKYLKIFCKIYIFYDIVNFTIFNQIFTRSSTIFIENSVIFPTRWRICALFLGYSV